VGQLARNHEVLITVEEGAQQGGFGSAVLHSLLKSGQLPRHLKIRTLALPDLFQDQDTQKRMYEQAGLDAASIAETALSLLQRAPLAAFHYQADSASAAETRKLGLTSDKPAMSVAINATQAACK
jgi:1-deoxy-D-xylulose-5-phosphate synthase